MNAFVPDLVREHFPHALRVLSNWVLWRLEQVPGKDRPTKVPYTRRGSKASSTNSGSWCQLDDALAAQAKGGYDGVGFVFAEGAFAGIDLDHCRDPETGAIDSWARAVLDRLQSYSEASPSGTGIHVIVQATLPGKGKKRRVEANGAQPDAAIEMYDRGRYFTVTGCRLAEYPATVEPRQDAVTAVYERMAATKRTAERPRPPSVPGDISDAALIEKAMTAKNGDAFRRLWQGDTSGHGGDDSAADLALCDRLAFWCGPDVARIDALFRQSGLYREKWDRDDYRNATIAKALDGRTEFYGSRSPAPGAGAATATQPGGDAYVLIPGQHIDGDGVLHEVGTDDFAKTVLDRLPLGALYRMDFVVGEIVGDPGTRRFAEVTDHRLRTVVDEHVRLAKWTKGKDDVPSRTFVACNRDQAGLLLAAAGASPRIQELRLLVHHPVYVSDFVLARPGWNPATGVFYDEPPELRDLVPRAEGAVEILRDLSIDFPFKDEASRQNAYGAMVTAVIRPAIAGKVPFHLAMSSLERTGKGKLIDTVVGHAVLGRAIAPMQPGRTEEEREKRITSLLLQGETVVHLDNLAVGEVLDSASLASLATSWPLWRGRTLGVSRAPLLPNNLVVFLSGNNPRTTGEIAKRTVPIALQPKDDHPEDRHDFVHPDAEGYAKSRRRAVLEALLGIVEAWKAAGCPAAEHRRTMGGFEKWAATVGGILAHVGLDEWMGNYRTWVRGADEWTSDAEVLIEAWEREFGTAPVKPKQVLGLIRDLEVFPSVTVKDSEGAQFSALGKRVLTPLMDRPVGMWRVDTDGKGGSKYYFLREHLPTGTGAGHAPRREPDGPHDPEGSEGLEGSGANVMCAHAQVRTYAHAHEPWGAAGNPSNPADPSETRRQTRSSTGACGA
ncbi:MAG: hypothetical protein K8T90_09140 [Planctomycetes bacterium]|nr:hypothetical protein [Planctomycetota bacterium]